MYLFVIRSIKYDLNQTKLTEGEIGSGLSRKKQRANALLCLKASQTCPIILNDFVNCIAPIMTNKELRKLTKEDLLELLIGQAKSAEIQQKEIEDLTARIRALEEENGRLRSALAGRRDENGRLI